MAKTPNPNRTVLTKTASELYAGAERAEAEQESLIGGANLDQLYQEALASYVESKISQVGAIEDRLESLVDRQRDSLQSLRVNAPGLLSMPSAKRAWQSAQVVQQARLQQLTGRLSAVREIKEDMGLHSSKIEELATRKLRIENPGLASDWDFMRETERVRQALLRERKPESKKLSVGLSHKKVLKS